MAIQVNVHEAKAQLSALLARVEAGEEVTIARRGSPIATLTAATPQRRPLGFVTGSVPDSFFEPLTDDELAVWEGRG